MAEPIDWTKIGEVVKPGSLNVDEDVVYEEVEPLNKESFKQLILGTWLPLPSWEEMEKSQAEAEKCRRLYYENLLKTDKPKSKEINKMIKLSDFPQGTVVTVNDELCVLDGVVWTRTNSRNLYYTMGHMNELQSLGETAIVGIPYPVALKLAEWASRDDNPEELIIKASKAI